MPKLIHFNSKRTHLSIFIQLYTNSGSGTQQTYIGIPTLQAVLTHHQISLRHATCFSILLRYPPCATWPLSKDNPTDVFVCTWCRSNPNSFSQESPDMHCWDLVPTICRGLDWAGPARLVEPQVCLSSGAETLAQCISQFLKVPPPSAFKVVLSRPLHRFTSPAAGAW